MATSGKNF